MSVGDRFDRRAKDLWPCTPIRLKARQSRYNSGFSIFPAEVFKMLVYRGLSQTAPAPTVLTIGNFDGVHLGHRALLARLGEVAARAKLLPAVLTFEPHPREFFAPASAPPRLSTLREKLELLADAGVALADVVHFNARFAAFSAEDFIAHVLVERLRVERLIIGDDFCFGAGRRGNLALLREAGKAQGFEVEGMDSVVVDGVRVSSSAVRGALADGKMEEAARLLGRPYSIDGRVVHGDKRGRQLGFATANIRIKHDKPPLAGVFAVEVRGLAGGPHRGIANLGVRPSIGQDARPLLEVHLFDFSADIYGAHLNVRFLHKIRDEVRFPDLMALKAQIADDVRDTKIYFHRKDAKGQR
jgi:riboflavin kinase/FMN adenylyltransferase